MLATGAVVEQIEARYMLTALQINGTAGVDTITLDTANYVFNGVNNTYPPGTTSITVNGNASADTITVTSGSTIATTINGGAGNDTIVGSGNTRDINGGDDDDVITFLRTVGFGFGIVKGDSGNDLLIGTSAGDDLNGGEGNDTLQGNNANTDIFGDDSLSGGTGDDTYVFGNLPTTRDFSISESSGGGTDTLDFSVVTTGLDIRLNGSTIASYPGGQVSGFVNNIENVIGGSGDDSITGNDGANTLIGGGGNDAINGRDGNDRLEGGIGRDTLTGGEGNDRAIGNAGSDVYTFSTAFTNQTDTLINFDDETGSDTIDFFGRSTLDNTTVPVTIDLNAEIVATHAFRTVVNILNDLPSRLENAIGGSADDLIIGSDGINTLLGGGGIDDLRGGFGNDVLDGNEGADFYDGGFGDDRFVFTPQLTSAFDYVIEESNQGTDTLDFSALPAGDTVNANLGIDFMATHTNRTVQAYFSGQFVNFENVVGGAGSDRIAGNVANNVLDGGAGNDTLDGTSGNDTYRFGPITSGFDDDVVFEVSNNGTDTLDFSPLLASDNVAVNLGDDLLATHVNRRVRTFTPGQFANIENAIGGAGDDTLTGNVGANSLFGNLGKDSLIGDDGNDTLDGHGGSDSLLGGDNNDLYRFNTDSSPVNEVDIITELANQGIDTLDFSLSGSGTKAAVNLGSDAALAQQLNAGGGDLLRTVSMPAGQSANIENAIGSGQNDTLTGNNANNSLTGGGGGDSLRGENGADSLVGDGGNDTFVGGAGSDTLVGGGNDDLYRFGGAVSPTEADRVSEAAGGGTDTLDFSALPSPGGVVVNLLSDTLATHTNRVLSTLVAGQAPQFENVIGSVGADNITGNNANNTIVGGSGADSLRGENGSDSLVGDAGNDTFVGGAGSDTLVGGGNDDLYRFGGAVSPTEADRVSEAAGGGTDTLDFSALPAATGVVVNLLSDTLATHTNRVLSTLVAGQAPQFENVIGSISADNITGNNANNTIVGGSGADSLRGENGSDSLVGDAGNDTFVGGAGSDTLVGGANDDLYRFGGAVSPTEADRVSEAVGGGTDTLDFSALPAASGVVVNLLSDTLATHTNRVLSTLVAGQAPQFENVIGSISADNITGNNANNTIVGGLGNDTLTGGLGLDRLDGGDNDDTFFARGTPADADTILGGAGSDSLQRDTLDSATLVEIILP